MMDDRVIVEVEFLVLKHEKDDVYVARITELGLSGYGTSDEEAIASCKRLFKRFVNTYREADMLESILRKSGLRWYWEKDVPSELQFEGTSDGPKSITLDMGAVEVAKNPKAIVNAFADLWVSSSPSSPIGREAVAA